MPSRAPQHRPPHYRPYTKPASTNEPYYKTSEWKTLRMQCMQRDGHRCTVVDCKTPTHRLTAHHIIERSIGGADALYNLRMLCTNCHNTIHGKRGLN